jgi:hypothetical protein
VTAPDRLELNVFSWHSPVDQAQLSSLLQAFDSNIDLAPTHYSSGDSEDPKVTYQPYDRHQFLADVSNFDEYEELPVLYRKERPKYEAEVSNNGSGLNSVSVMFDARLKVKDLSQILHVLILFGMTLTMSTFILPESELGISNLTAWFLSLLVIGLVHI